MKNIEGTAYQMIADVIGLTQHGKIWIDNNGEKFVWTKYGFQYAVIEASKIQERDKVRQLLKDKSNLEKRISKLRNEISGLKG